MNGAADTTFRYTTIRTLIAGDACSEELMPSGSAFRESQSALRPRVGSRYASTTGVLTKKLLEPVFNNMLQIFIFKFTLYSIAKKDLSIRKAGR